MSDSLDLFGAPAQLEPAKAQSGQKRKPTRKRKPEPVQQPEPAQQLEPVQPESEPEQQPEPDDMEAVDEVEAAIRKTLGGDAGALFEEHAVSALYQVRLMDDAEYNRLRTRIKTECKNVSVTRLEAAMDKLDKPEKQSSLQGHADVKPREEREFSAKWAMVGATLPKGYGIDDDGVIDPRDKPITRKPVWVSETVRGHDGSNFGQVVKFIDRDGNLKTHIIKCSRLSESADAITAELMSMGAMLIPSAFNKFRDYLAAFNPPKRAFCVSQLGWVETPDEALIYALPDGAMSRTGNASIYYMPSSYSSHAGALSETGTLEDWKRRIAEPSRGNPLLVFALCYGLAAPLLKLTRNTASGGVHFYGHSSTGKTTLLQVAASVWGCGADPASAPTLSLIQNWNSTGNALEVLAETANDGLLLLDEIGSCAAKVVDDSCYKLMNGKGRNRLDSNADTKPPRAWRLLAMSSGERSIAEIVKGEGKEQKAGQRIRFLDIPTGDKIIVDTHSVDAALFAKALKRSCGEHYGHAGREFIRCLLQSEEGASFSTALQCIERVHTQIAPSLIPPDCTSEQQRAIERLALAACAGVLAIQFGVLPYSNAEVIDAVKHVRDLWLSDGGQTDAQRAVDNIREFILRHESRFQLVIKSEHTDPDKVPHNRAGFHYPAHSAGDLWLFTSDGFREACNGFDPSMTAKALQSLGLLYTNETDRLTSKHKIDGQSKSFYAVKAKIFGGSAQIQREPREPREPVIEINRLRGSRS